MTHRRLPRSPQMMWMKALPATEAHWQRRAAQDRKLHSSEQRLIPVAITACNDSSAHFVPTLAWIELSVGLNGERERMCRVLNHDSALLAVGLNDVRICGRWSERCYRAYLAKIANQDGVGAMCQNVISSIRSGVMTELKIPSGVRVVDGVRGPLSARASTGQYRVVPLTIARSQPPVAGADVRKPKD